MAVKDKTLSQFKVEFSKRAEDFIEKKEYDNIKIKIVRKSRG